MLVEELKIMVYELFSNLGYSDSVLDIIPSQDILFTRKMQSRLTEQLFMVGSFHLSHNVLAAQTATVCSLLILQKGVLKGGALI